MSKCEKKRWPIPAVISAIVKNGKILLVKRKNDPDAGLWAFPGGKVELGESIEEAAERELFEETSIKAKAIKIFNAHSFVSKQNGEIEHHFVILSVLCQWQAGEAIAGDDALETRWADLNDLKKNKNNLVKYVGMIAEMAVALENGKLSSDKEI